MWRVINTETNLWVLTPGNRKPLEFEGQTTAEAFAQTLNEKHRVYHWEARMHPDIFSKDEDETKPPLWPIVVIYFAILLILALSIIFL